MPDTALRPVLPTAQALAAEAAPSRWVPADGLWLGTRVQAVPFQCRISVLRPALPTAQAFPAGAAGMSNGAGIRSLWLLVSRGLARAITARAIQVSHHGRAHQCEQAKYYEDLEQGGANFDIRVYQAYQ